MAAESWLDLARWDRRPKAFGPLREHDDGRPVVATEYAPRHQTNLADWSRLRELWLDLPPHPHVLDALEPQGARTIVLRYAALDWKFVPIPIPLDDRGERELVAGWGVQLIDVFAMILREVPPADVWRFLRPVVWIDLDRAVRVSFLPVVLGDEPINGDERTIAFVIGTAVRDLCAGIFCYESWGIVQILDRARGADGGTGYATLADLRSALRLSFPTAASRTGEHLAAWTLAEEGAGWLELGRAARAVDLFENALELDPQLLVATQGIRRAFEMLGVVSGAVSEGPRQRAPGPAREMREAAPVRIVWSVAEEQGRKLENERAFSEALAIYSRAYTGGPTDALIYSAIARCWLALGNAGHAIDYAQRALAVDSKHVEALSIRVRGYLLAHRYEDALKCAGVWLAASGDDAGAHYAYGRALLALGRYLEAREAFDRACTLRPQMLEAMLLRREADRAAIRVREQVGTQPAIQIELPEHLAGLRDALSKGQIDDVIAMLERPEYEADGAAALVHARCLAFEKRFADAVAMYDRAAALSSDQRAVAIGKAHALLALNRAEDALALFDRAASQALGDLEAIEGRALALRMLHRDAEADEALERVLAASGGRSELRVSSLRR